MQIHSCSCAGYLFASERCTGDAADVTGHSRKVSQGGALSIDATAIRHYCTLLAARFCVTLCDAASVLQARGVSEENRARVIGHPFAPHECRDYARVALTQLS